MDKLSELSKPVGRFALEPLEGRWHHVKHGERQHLAGGPWKLENLYSQEYVSALLAELEAKDKRITELEVTQMTGPLALVLERTAVLERITEGVDQLAIDGGWTARGMSEYAKSLEKKLATPVRLPNKNDDEFWFDDVFQVAKFDCAVERAISAAGFKFVGDE